jgi:hypothetical protein
VLRELWGTMTASAIGARLGRSKGGVIGRAHRMGLPDAVEAIHKVLFEGKPTAKNRSAEKCGPDKRTPGIIRPPTKPVDKSAPDEPFRGIIFWGLRAGVCHYPRGDSGEFTFCGEPTPGVKHPWCAYHRGIVWQPREPRKRPPETKGKSTPGALAAAACSTSR